MQVQNQYLHYLFHPNFQGPKIIFALSYKDNASTSGHTEFFFSKEKIKSYSIVTKGRPQFDQLVKYDIRTHGYIRKITPGKEMTIQLAAYLTVHTSKETIS